MLKPNSPKPISDWPTGEASIFDQLSQNDNLQISEVIQEQSGLIVLGKIALGFGRVVGYDPSITEVIRNRCTRKTN
jgi:hypothetical protein